MIRVSNSYKSAYSLGVVILRRIIILVIFLLSIISIVGCSQSSGNIEKQEYLEPNLSVSNYYPCFKSRNHYSKSIGTQRR